MVEGSGLFFQAPKTEQRGPEQFQSALLRYSISIVRVVHDRSCIDGALFHAGPTLPG